MTLLSTAVFYCKLEVINHSRMTERIKLLSLYSTNKFVMLSLCRCYDLVDSPNGILKKAREIFLTGCYLRTAKEGCGSPRLLPTEYLVILLDEVTCYV